METVDNPMADDENELLGQESEELIEALMQQYRGLRQLLKDLQEGRISNEEFERKLALFNKQGKVHGRKVKELGKKWKALAA